jgi:uncharacterized membrane protein YdcZ (DUF606 family)
MWIWVILQLVTIASMPTAYDMARERGRSPKAWLWAAFFVGPLALLALLLVGRGRSGPDTLNGGATWP